MGNDILFTKNKIGDIQSTQTVAYGTEVGSDQNIQKQDLENPEKSSQLSDILKQIVQINSNITTILAGLGVLSVSALPVLPDSHFPSGFVVFLTTTGKLFRSTGTTWVQVDQGGSIMGLPFDGTLGNGRHGAKVVSTNETATDIIPIYQLTSLNVQSGKTWTAYAQNPGGFIISVSGRCTITGTIDVNSRGGIGGPADSTDAQGYDGDLGYHFAGTGGGGGASSVGVNHGGHGGWNRAHYPFGGWSPGGFRRASGDTSWMGDGSADNVNTVRGQAGTASNPGGNGGSGAGAAGAVGQAATNIAFNTDTLFNTLWALYRSQIIGWGAGGGGGAAIDGGGNTPGAGGKGGGYLVILCDELDFTGTINSKGEAGGNGGAGSGGGGGGGGGCVIIGYRTLIANTGTVNLNAGAAGAAGSGGAGAGAAGGAGFSKIFDMRL